MKPLSLFKSITLILIFFSTNYVFSQNGVGVNTVTPKSSFEDNGSFGKKVSTISTSVTLDENYSTIVCDNGSTPITITLPSAATCNARIYEIKRAVNVLNTATVTIVGTIDGAVNYLLSNSGQSVTVFSDGTTWLKRDGSNEAVAGNDWSLIGNAGTTGSNFLGTNDAQDLVFKTNGAEAARIQSGSGFVSIGSTIPYGRLTVVNNGQGFGITDDIALVSYDSPPGASFYTYSARGTEAAAQNLSNYDGILNIVGMAYTNGSFGSAFSAIKSNYRGDGLTNLTDMSFITSSAERMKLSQFGELGIGIDPTERLHIYNEVAPNVLLESNGVAGKTLTYKLKPWFGMGANTYVGFGAIDDGLNSARAAIFVPNAANNGVAEAFTILKWSGYVGVGTAAPTENLHIFNNDEPSVLLESNGGVGKTMSYLIRPDNLMAANTAVGFGAVDDGLNSARAAIFVPNAVNTGVMEAVSVLKATGYVGIATQTPSSSLAINGSLAAKYTSTSVNLVLNNTHYSVISTAAGTITVSLPNANTCLNRIYVIAATGGGAITLASPTGAPVNQFYNISTTAVAGTTIIANGTTRTFISDGTNWRRIQ